MAPVCVLRVRLEAEPLLDQLDELEGLALSLIGRHAPACRALSARLDALLAYGGEPVLLALPGGGLAVADLAIAALLRDGRALGVI